MPSDETGPDLGVELFFDLNEETGSEFELTVCFQV